MSPWRAICNIRQAWRSRANVLYVGETSRVTRMTIGADMQASNEQRIITDLPSGGNHITRTVLIGARWQALCLDWLVM